MSFGLVTFGVWWQIVGVALGFVLANAVQLVYLTAALARQRIRLHWRLTVRHAWTREYLSKAGPTFLSHSVRFGSTFVDRVFASTLVAGRIAAINFAQVLAQMPLTLAHPAGPTPDARGDHGGFGCHGEQYYRGLSPDTTIGICGSRYRYGDGSDSVCPHSNGVAAVVEDLAGACPAKFWLRWGAGMVIFSEFMEGGYQAAIGLGWDTGIWLAAAQHSGSTGGLRSRANPYRSRVGRADYAGSAQEAWGKTLIHRTTS